MFNTITQTKTSIIKLNVIFFDIPINKIIKEKMQVKNNCFFVNSRRNPPQQNITIDKKKLLNSN